MFWLICSFHAILSLLTTKGRINFNKMKIFIVVVYVYVMWTQFSNVLGFHDTVHHSTMRTVYEVQLDHIELVNNTETVLRNVQVRVKKFNRTSYVLTGTFESIVQFDDDFSSTIIISALQGNEYKVIVPAKDYDKLCTYLATEKMVYPEVQAHSNFPAPGLCPAPMGHYKITDYAAQNTQLPELPSAGEKWKGDIIVKYKGVSVTHLAIYSIVIPKRVRVDD